MYWDSDIDSSALTGKTVAVLGYGSQGRGQALNLRDSGLNVVVGLRENGPTWKLAVKDGFEPLIPANAVAKADLVAMLVPDLAQPAVYESAVKENIKDGATLLFSHGFNIHFRQIITSDSIDVVMIAPKGPGRLVRRTFEEGGGVPCLVAVAHDSTGAAKQKALAYGQAVGGGKAGIIETTFAEETETDLFGEQAVLCGGATELIKAGFETLVEAGYQPEVAYFECLHELKLIVDLIYEGGFAKMHEYVSETAIFGDITRGPRIVTAETKAEMKKILTEIQEGVFASEWISENQAGKPRYFALQNKDLNHQIETVGREIRKQMSWLDTEK